jgi:hypothetical protein
VSASQGWDKRPAAHAQRPGDSAHAPGEGLAAERTARLIAQGNSDQARLQGGPGPGFGVSMNRSPLPNVRSSTSSEGIPRPPGVVPLVARQHRPVPLQPRRMTQQGSVLEAAARQVQQNYELRPDVIRDIARRPAGLASDAVSRIWARYPASVIVITFRRRA